jgi:transcriptional regulator with XRE-family HTH domain
MNLARSIADQIKNWRGDGGCSQTWLAQRSRMPQSVVSRAESGRHMPTLKTLQRLAKPLNADVIVRLVRRDQSPLDDDLVERVAAAMVDCHPDSGRGFRWADWVKQSKDTAGKPYEREMAEEWMAARRLEAKAAIETISKRTPGA